MTQLAFAGDAKTRFADAISDALDRARKPRSVDADLTRTIMVGDTSVQVAETHPVVGPFLDQTLAPPFGVSDGSAGFLLWCDYTGLLARHGLHGATLAGLKRDDAEEVLADLGLRGRCAFSLSAWDILDEAHGIGIRLQASPHGYAAWEPTSPLEFFLNGIIESNGDAMLHAACVGENGVGVMIVGDGGMGKSGTTLAAISQGMKTVGDDYIRIRRGVGLVARPVFRTLKQDRAGLVRNGFEAFATTGITNHAGKQVIPIDRFAPDALVEKLRIVAIALPRVHDDPATIVAPASRTEAFRALAPSNLPRAGQRGAGMISLTSNLARDLPAFKINLGRDPGSIAGGLRQILAAVTT